MSEDARMEAVRRKIYDYVRSPSLRHIRDDYALTKLAGDIVRCIDRGSSILRNRMDTVSFSARPACAAGYRSQLCTKL